MDRTSPHETVVFRATNLLAGKTATGGRERASV